ncbi:flagellar basal body P-ring formation chaperone FlgA [Planktotalea sp.]|uniref:flagellar basal body P-ring formation chaperone FlgA n=1 Tax=Planktotalea sp. TaxID=2029877 RepID=UPI0032970D6D
MRSILSLLCILHALPAVADMAIVTRNVRPGEILLDKDVIVIRGNAGDGFSEKELVVGKEAQVALFAGRAILKEQVAPAPSVERNQIVELVYTTGVLSMTTEGRALGRGAEGQRIRVMNLASKTSIFGTIQRDGTVLVTK